MRFIVVVWAIAGLVGFIAVWAVQNPHEPGEVALSALEQKELEIIQLKRKNLEMQLQLWQQQLKQISAEIEAEHVALEKAAIAAHNLNSSTYQLDEAKGELVLKPEAANKPAQPAPAPPAEKGGPNGQAKK